MNFKSGKVEKWKGFIVIFEKWKGIIFNFEKSKSGKASF